jgi:hypothetical protein
MKAGPRIVTAVAIGYVLGRTHKMKLAIALAGMMAGRQIATNPRELLQQGARIVASSPEVSKLSGEVRDQLIDAMKAAAVAAASNKIDSLGDNLSERAARLRSSQSKVSEVAGAERQTDEAEERRAETESVPRQRQPQKRAATAVGRTGAPSGRRSRPTERKPGARGRSEREAGMSGTNARSAEPRSKRGGHDD